MSTYKCQAKTLKNRHFYGRQLSLTSNLHFQMKGPFKNFQLGIDHISGVRTRGEKKNERNEKEGAEIE